MKYVCTQCGRIMPFDDPVLVIDPDGDARCMDCYQEDRTDWFDDEPEEPDLSAVIKDPPQLDCDGKPVKERMTLLQKAAVIVACIALMVVAAALLFPTQVIDWLTRTGL